MAIYLSDDLFRIMVEKLDRESGHSEWSRYTGQVLDDGTMEVYAWVSNSPRLIGARPVPAARPQ
jgi:hypothetical protein